MTATRRGLSIWAVTTAAYLVLGAIGQALGLDRHRYPTSPAASWPFRLFARGDAGHFLEVARHGYFGPHHDPVQMAFFPGYPLAGRGLAHLFSVGPPSVTTYLVALSLVSWLGTATAAILLWRLTADQVGEPAASVAVVVLLAGPYSIFLVSSYSEGPFLAAALGAWVAAKADRWAIASACAAMAAFTRISGLFLACGLVVLFVHSRATQRKSWQATHVAALSAPFLAVVGYFTWLHHNTGDWLAWFHAERLGWGRHAVTPVRAFTHSVRRILTYHDPDDWQLAALRFQGTMEILFAAAFIAACVALLRRREWAEATYVGFTAASLLTSAYYLSLPRNMLTCFPVAMLSAQWILRHRERKVRYTIAAGSVAIAMFNVSSILSDHWSG
ncbi:MAG: hypothetical protein QOJ11_2757 [Frankiales bacterium]|jgi:hypothetical protein|nr:hypothetical protein [Frankiales bacterium]